MILACGIFLAAVWIFSLYQWPYGRRGLRPGARILQHVMPDFGERRLRRRQAAWRARRK